MSSLLDGLGGKASPEEDGPITSKSAITPPKAEKTGATAAAADDEEEPTPKPKSAVGKEAVADEEKPVVKPKVPIEEETATPLKPPKAAVTATETEKIKGSEADPAAATSTNITAKQAYDRCVNAVDKSKCGDALAAWVYVIIAVAVVIVGLAAWYGARRYKRKHKRATASAVLPAYSPYVPPPVQR